MQHLEVLRLYRIPGALLIIYEQGAFVYRQINTANVPCFLIGDLYRIAPIVSVPELGTRGFRAWEYGNYGETDEFC